MGVPVPVPSSLSFIDYSAAFDSISHKFLDKALKRAKVSVKTRRMFRAIYRVTNTVTH